MSEGLDDSDQPAELGALIQRMCDGTATVEDRDRLETHLLASKEARDVLLTYLGMHGELQWYFRGESPESLPQSAAAVSMAPAVQSPSRRSPVLGMLVGGLVRSVVNSPLIATLLVAAVIYGAFTYLAWDLRSKKLATAFSRNDTPIALIGKMADVHWSSDVLPKQTESPVHIGDLLKIDAGQMALKLTRGVELMVEGPAEWTVESDNGITLNRGKLVAKVPKQAIGFVVDTPTAQIVDLGTEFGVEVSEGGRAQVEVFLGQVEVEHKQSPQAGAGSVAPQGRVRLRAGQAFVTTGNSATLANPSPSRFTHHQQTSAQKYLDLADIVAGGNGLGHLREQGIDPTTGAIVPFPQEDFAKFGYLSGNDIYHAVLDRPLVDGVFVPSGGDRLTQLDSLGHKFQFPKTDGLAFGPVWAGGRIPVRADNVGIATVLADEIDYAPESRGLISVHPNKGITFNLEAIRQTHPGHRITGFTARVGCSATTGSAQSAERAADLWVFIDGKPSVEGRVIERFGQPIALMIPLAADAKFLSLAVTDAGGSILDWVIFGIPRLQIAVKATAKDGIRPKQSTRGRTPD